MRTHVRASLASIALMVCYIGQSLAAQLSDPSTSPASRPIQPEHCVLDTLKTAPAGAEAMVRYNCVRQYSKAVELDAASYEAHP